MSETGSATRRYPLSRVFLFLAIALGGAGFDLAAKSVVFKMIGEPELSAPLSVVPDILELRTSYNPGALWGFGRNWGYSSLVFAGLSVIAGLGITYYLFILGAARDGRLTAALGLIMAGAIGNCYDRLVFGQVRDFVHFHVDAINFDCAIFNFADNMLVLGAVSLMLMALRPEPEAPPGGDAPAPAESLPSPTA